MKNTVIKVLKTLVRAFKAVLHFLGAGHPCKCKDESQTSENKTSDAPVNDAE